jgi:Signal transduction histidine kinase
MQHSLFDRIYVLFLVIMIISFGFLIIFISYFARRSLITERIETLSNEAQLIASQSLGGYLTGRMSDEEMEYMLDYYSSMLKSDIWYVDSNGLIVAKSSRTSPAKLDDSTSSENTSNTTNDTTETSTENEYAPIVSNIPKSIYMIYKGYTINESFSMVGNFYGIFNSDVITVNVPIKYLSVDDTTSSPAGAILLHASTNQINDMMTNIYSITLIPCLVIIVIAFTFIAIVSRKIIRPIKHLSGVARDYSEGNFDVKTGIESKDEIGQLADSMEYMADELSKLEQYRHDFVSNISHDFRSPLTSIKGYVQAILDGTIPPEKHERYLNIVLDETQRLTKLTQGLLDLNHLEIYGPYLKMSDFDFIDVVKSTLNTFEIKCIDKGLAIYLNNHAENTIVTADQTKIQQVVYNLIDNAIKFTPSGKKINVSIHETNDKLYVTVKDEGIGMNEDTQRKIWTRFYKGDSSRGKDKQGTGLGLAITKEIIKAHNETIEVSSTEGQGSQFVFSLTKAKQEPSHTGQTEILISNKLR